MSEVPEDLVQCENEGKCLLSCEEEESVGEWAWEDPVTRQLYRGTRLLVTQARLQEERRKLPIWAKKEELVEQLRTSQVLVVKGETGSGKSTQLPQFFQGEAWWDRYG